MQPTLPPPQGQEPVRHVCLACARKRGGAALPTSTSVCHFRCLQLNWQKFEKLLAKNGSVAWHWLSCRSNVPMPIHTSHPARSLKIAIRAMLLLWLSKMSIVRQGGKEAAQLQPRHF
ncbi:unnamed protein product [Effrenium voratum]|nr:unnamed protein product [Effrenium voratum]